MNTQPAMSQAQPAPAYLTHDAALKKWGHFSDSAIRRHSLSLEASMVGLVAAGATEEQIKLFWLVVKHLAWPGNWGQSPWETASYLGASLEARDLGPAFSRIGEEHVSAFRKAIQSSTTH